MKKLLILFLFSTGLYAQFSRTASYIVNSASLPATCSPLNGAIYFVDSGGGLGPYYCSAVNTWSPMFASSGAGVTTAVTLTADLPVIGAGGSAVAVGTKTGTGTVFVTNTSPTLVTPTLGAALATSINGLTITSSTGTLTITNAKTLSVSNTLTFTGTDSSSVAFGAGGTVAYIGAANAWADGVKQTFNPDGTTAGFNVGSQAGDPGTPANGDIWYDSTANELTARINGANVALGAGGGAPTGASYVVLGVDGTLTAERVLTQGSGITITDAGAGSTITVAFDSSVLSGVYPTLAGPNTFTAGGTNIMSASATTEGFRIAATAIPSTPTAGALMVGLTALLHLYNGTNIQTYPFVLGSGVTPATAPTSGRITIWSSGFGQTEDADLSFATDTLTVTNLTVSTTLTPGSAAIAFPDGVRQTFNPNGTNAGVNVGSQAGDPSAPSNGDLWYDSTANELTARINGANVALGAGSSVANYYTSTTFTGIGPTSFTPTVGTLTVYDATATTGDTKLMIRAGAATLTDQFPISVRANNGTTENFTVRGDGNVTATIGYQDTALAFAISASGGLKLATTLGVQFSGNAVYFSGVDVAIFRSAAGKLEINDSNSGTYRDLLLRQLITNPVAVASLQTCNAGNKGARSFVTDATATTFLSTVAGGGANNVPVACDGTNWVIG